MNTTKEAILEEYQEKFYGRKSEFRSIDAYLDVMNWLSQKLDEVEAEITKKVRSEEARTRLDPNTGQLKNK